MTDNNIKQLDEEIRQLEELFEEEVKESSILKQRLSLSRTNLNEKLHELGKATGEPFVDVVRQKEMIYVSVLMSKELYDAINYVGKKSERICTLVEIGLKSSNKG